MIGVSSGGIAAGGDAVAALAKAPTVAVGGIEAAGGRTVEMDGAGATRGTPRDCCPRTGGRAGAGCITWMSFASSCALVGGRGGKVIGGMCASRWSVRSCLGAAGSGRRERSAPRSTSTPATISCAVRSSRPQGAPTGSVEGERQVLATGQGLADRAGQRVARPELDEDLGRRRATPPRPCAGSRSAAALGPAGPCAPCCGPADSGCWWHWCRSARHRRGGSCGHGSGPRSPRRGRARRSAPRCRGRDRSPARGRSAPGRGRRPGRRRRSRSRPGH